MQWAREDYLDLAAIGAGLLALLAWAALPSLPAVGFAPWWLWTSLAAIGIILICIGGARQARLRPPRRDMVLFLKGGAIVSLGVAAIVGLTQHYVFLWPWTAINADYASAEIFIRGLLGAPVAVITGGLVIIAGALQGSSRGKGLAKLQTDMRLGRAGPATRRDAAAVLSGKAPAVRFKFKE